MPSKIIQFIYIVFLLFFSLPSFATGRVASLIREVEHMDNSEDKVLFLVELADSLVSLETIQSLKYAQQARSNAQKLDYKRGIGLAYYQIAKAEYYRDEYDLALEASAKATKAFLIADEKLNIAKTHYLTGNIYSYKGDLVHSILFLEKALVIFNQSKDPNWEADTYASLGMAYNQYENNDSALIYLNQSISIYNGLKNPKLKKLLRAYVLKGIVLNDEEKYDDAISIYLRALEIATDINDTYNIHICKTNLGWTYQIIGKYPEAITFCSEALADAEKMNNVLSITENNRCLGLVYMKLGQYNQAESYFLNGLDVAKESSLKEEIIDFYQNIIDLYITQGNYKKGLQVSQEFKNHIDTLNSQEYDRNIVEEKERYNELENRLNNDLQVKEQTIVSWRLFGSSLIGLLTIGLGWLFFQLKKERKTFALQLETVEKKHNLAIGQVKDELEKFTYAASHDLKEPIRNIMSFSGLLHKRLSKKYQDIELAEYSNFVVQGARQMYDTIIGILEFSAVNTFPTQLTAVNLNDVIHSTLISLEVLMNNKNGVVNFNTELPDSIITNESYVRLIFKNLIENSITYNDSDVPTVSIDYEISDNYHVFKISDNGVGIDEQYHDYVFDMFKRLHAREDYQGTGMGLSITKKLVEALDGSIRVEKTSTAGSTFSFSLPIN